jgi:hypothetical protein
LAYGRLAYGRLAYGRLARSCTVTAVY